MNFLIEEGFSEELVQKLKSRYDESTLDIFKLEQENVVDVIHYFRKIGIQRIEDLLLSHIEVFTKDINDVKDAFLKHNIKTVVDEINENITVIDYV